jgi:hypothetical protein
VLLFNAGSKGGFPLLISPVMITNGRGGGSKGTKPQILNVVQ